MEQLMVNILIATGFLAGMGLLLSALLVIAEKSILNFGPCTIDINNSEKILKVKGGGSLLSILARESIFIPSACGGRGSCAYCKVIVKNGGGPVSPVEEPYLSDEERKRNTRLSCQVKVRNDISIEIPREYFSVRKYRGKLISKRPLTHDIFELRIELLEPREITFTAGQYIQLKSKEYKGRESVIRAYSMSSVPSDKNHVELIIRRVPDGICTTWIFDYLEEGQNVGLSGPYGEFKLQPTDSPILFIAGGSGMAPIWSMLRDMREKGIKRKAHYFFGALTQKDLFFLDELRQLERELPDFKFIPSLSREPENSNWTGERGIITDVVKKYIPDTSGYEAYLCGSPGMIDACIKALTSTGMPVEKIYYDKFA
ncbi:MAG: 2Fe-2S iron-sulfur cluster binding domain-containing protein [Chitinispirillaceae bacterium]|nr:2Fe-2S iron-sulfur cluster binding domain-containing protein [Chitinispirillaceae bacterium]